ncbi:MAG TPA: DUF2550 family protein [Jatrophihabitans sp.]
MTLVEIIGLVVVCLVVASGIAAWALVVLHQRRMVASDGALPVALKRGEQRWANGVGRYSGDEFVWYRTLSLLPTAAMRLQRRRLRVVRSRAWDARSDMALRPNLSIVECTFDDEELSLGFPADGLTGFLSWLEASAPRF